MAKILIISFSDLDSDPRVNRQIRFLSYAHNVTTLGLRNSQIEKVDHLRIYINKKTILQKINLSVTLIFQKYEFFYWRQTHVLDSLKQLIDLSFDLIIANDIDSLPLALKIANGAKIIFDAHEYAPREFEDRFLFRLLFQKYKTYLCNTYIPKVDRMITVCQKIADTYQQDTGIKPVVITNAPDYEDLQPQLVDKTKTKIRLVHHGGAMSSRRLDKLIKLMDFLTPNYELNLILTGSFYSYINYLKKLAQGKPNIKFLEPVPMRAIAHYLNQFDIGIYILEPSNFNNLNALPNKLFEFIQARLAIAIGPSPEMARVVKEHDLGIVAEDFEPETLAKKIMNLDYEKINYYKNQSHKAAYSLSAESNKQLLLNLVQETLNS